MLKTIILSFCVFSSFICGSDTLTTDSKTYTYSEFLEKAHQDRKREDKRLEEALSLSPTAAANACLREWGVKEVLTQTDPKELFDILLKHSCSLDGLTNSDFGYTFKQKNSPVIDPFLESIEHWDQPLSIVEVGAGKGLSAFYLIKQIIHILKEQSITPREPIQIHISDLLYGNHLRNLATIINAAFGTVVQVRAETLDITSIHIRLRNPADYILALNVFHYIPGDNWPAALKNMEKSLKTGGKILMSVDELKAYDGRTSYLDFRDKREHPVNNLKKLLEEKPFFIPDFTVYDHTKESREKGLVIRNCTGNNFLKIPTQPGLDSGAEFVISEEILVILNNFARERGGYNSTELGLGKTVSEIMNCLKEGKLHVLMWPYCFTIESLRKALERSMLDGLRVDQIRHYGVLYGSKEINFGIYVNIVKPLEEEFVWQPPTT